MSETVTDLVRGSLCPALKNIFEHGMKRQSFLGGSYHPWHFIEEVQYRPGLLFILTYFSHRIAFHLD